MFPTAWLRNHSISRRLAPRLLRVEGLEDRIAPVADATQLFRKADGPITTALNGLVREIGDSTAELPVIGQSLSAAAGAARNQVTALLSGLGKLGNTNTNQALRAAFAAIDGAAAAAAIRAAVPGAENVVVTIDPNSNAVTVRMDLVRELFNKQVKLDFALPVLPYEITQAAVNYKATLRYDGLEFAFAADGKTFSFKFDQADELKLEVSASVAANTEMTGNFGFLQGKAKVNGGTTGLFGSLVVDVQSLGAVSLPRFAGLNAHVDLHLLGTFSNVGLKQGLTLPNMQADLVFDWNLSGNHQAQAGALGSPPQLSLNNVGIGLGTLLSGAIAPVVNVIQKITSPVQPALDLLKTPIPGLSDLGLGDVTLLELANVAKDEGLIPPPFDLIVTLTNQLSPIITVINKIKEQVPGEGLFINLGNYDLTAANKGNLRDVAGVGGAARTLSQMNKNNLAQSLSNLKFTAGAAKTIQDALNDLPLPPEIKAEALSAFNRLTQPAFGVDLNFPVIDDPFGSAVKIILGQDVDFTRFKIVANIDFPTRELLRFPLLPPAMDGTLTGAIKFNANFDIRYDSYGLRKFLANGLRNPADLAAGFAIASDKDLIYLKAAGGAGPTLNLLPVQYVFPNPLAFPPVVVVSPTAKLEASLAGEFRLRLNDPNADGTFRPFAESTSKLFNVDGRLNAAFRFLVECWYGPVKLATLYQKSLAETTIFDSTRITPDNPFDDPAPPHVFASTVKVNRSVSVAAIGGRTTGAPNRVVIEGRAGEFNGQPAQYIAITVNDDRTEEILHIGKVGPVVTELLDTLTVTGTSNVDEFILRGVTADVKIIGGGAVSKFLHAAGDPLTIDNRYDLLPPGPGSTWAYSLQNGKIERFLTGGLPPPPVKIQYSGIESVRLITGSAQNDIEVLGLSGIPLTIDSTPAGAPPAGSPILGRLFHLRFDTPPPQSGGVNRITVRSRALAPDGSLLTVNGYAGLDTVRIVDEDTIGTIEETRYTITEGDVTRLRTYRPTKLTTKTVAGRLIYNGLNQLAVEHAVDVSLLGIRYDVAGLAVGTATSLVGGGGNDVFELGAGRNQMDALSFVNGDDGRSLKLDGGAGTDQVIFNDSANTNELQEQPGGGELFVRTVMPAWTVNNSIVYRTNRVQFAGAGATAYNQSIPFQGIEQLTLLGGSGENPFGDKETFVIGSNPGAAVAVYGGAGDDSVKVLSATLDGPLSGVSFAGGAGADTLAVDDDQAHTAGTYVVDLDQINARGRVISYSGAETIRLSTSYLADSVSVIGTPAGGTVDVNTRLGADSISVGKPSGGLDAISQTRVDGGGDAQDLLIIDDSGSAGLETRQYVMNDQALAGNGHVVFYNGLKALSVKGTYRDDEFYVGSTPVGMTTTLFGGLGQDRFNIGSSTFNLDDIKGSVRVDTGIGSKDSVFVYDQNKHDGGPNMTISAADVGSPVKIKRLFAPDITVAAANATTLTVQPSAQADFVFAESTVPGVELVLLNTGPFVGDPVKSRSVILGNDQVGVQALRAPVRVYATGNVQVIANDLADPAARDVFLRRKPAQSFDVYSITGLSPFPIDLELAPQSFAIVNGSAGDDRFHVEFEQTDLKWVLSGGAGRNTVDYSTWVGDAYINLAAGQASGLLSLANIHHAIGGAGNDILVGLGAGILSGGSGRDVLIAGTYDPNGPFGANPVTSLGGGAGQDLLVGGNTDFDQDRDSLAALLALWTANTDYATRSGEVSAFLNGHATSNGLTNLLYGGSELDVLFGAAPEFQDLVPGELTFPG